MRAVDAFCLVEGEDPLTLVAGVVGVLLTEDVVGVAVGELVELGSVVLLVGVGWGVRWWKTYGSRGQSVQRM